jgi:amino acid efflux transporter
VTKHPSLSTRQGTALLLGAVLGPGALVLPHLAARAAGPASVLAWAGLLLLSAPVALTFAELGTRFPDGGGVATFAGAAFGRTAAATVGWWFYGVVPVGILAGTLIGGDYVADALGRGRGTAFAVAVLLLAAAFAVNALGIRASGRFQLGMVALLVALLAAGIAASLPRLHRANFSPFAPHGTSGVLQAAGVLFFAFVGWEAASHLSAEFADGAAGLRRATLRTLAVVGVLYVGLAAATVGVLGPAATDTPVPLTALLEPAIGGAARPVTAVAALLLSFGAVNAYVAGAARLGAALARDGALPKWFAGGAAPGEVPYRSLLLLAAATALSTAAIFRLHLGLDPLMRATSACLAVVTATGCAAAVRLLPRRAGRGTALLATGMAGTAAACCGSFLILPAAIAGVTFAARVVSADRRDAEPDPAH